MSDIKEKIDLLVSKNSYNFEDLRTLVMVLRSDEGCPWDREQTCKSVRNEFIDETYEFIEGLDNNNNELMCEELGDVLFQIMFHSQIKAEESVFDVNDVIDGICKKMILRHPHVFGNVIVDNSDQVLKNWEIIKNDEKQRKTPYMQLDSISKSLPALMRAQKLIKKSEKIGLVDKIDDSENVKSIINLLDKFNESGDIECLGSVLFLLCGIAKNNGIEAEELLSKYNNSYLNQFKV